MGVVETTTIRVSSGPASYDVVVGQGLIGSLHTRLKGLSAGKPYRPFLITSPNIWKLWSARVRETFPEAQSPHVLFLPAGEKHKRMATVESLLEQLAEAGADRDALLIAFGGGVVGDITGFLASIYMRGVPYVQVPTTLLAQVDSSVGGKTGVNLAAGKNLAGSFYHPRLVLADIDLLSTLPKRELRAGLQESIKAGVIRDGKLFSFLYVNRKLVKSGDAAALGKIIAASIRVKAKVVGDDERESGVRMILNFGHTIGHAIEAATGYKKLLHGEAVAWGSIAALHVGLSRGAISDEEFARMANLIFAYGPLPRFRASAEALVALTAADKKTRSGRRAFVLPTGVGRVEVVFDVTDEELISAAAKMLAEMRAVTGPEAKAKGGESV